MTIHRIVDSHQHFWDLANDYPWLTHSPNKGLDIAPFARDYLPGDLANDAKPIAIDATVHIEAGWNRSDPVGETRWLADLAARTGRPDAIIAYADLSREDAAEVLAEHAGYPLVRGIRMLLTWHEDPKLCRAMRPDYLTDKIWLDNLGRFSDLGFSFDMQLYPPQMHQAAKVAEAFSDTRFIIDHLGLPVDHSKDGEEAWRNGLRALAQHDNVAIKLSGFIHILAEWSRAAAEPYVRFVLETFGAGRCIFGSNYPVDSGLVAMPRLVSDLATIVGPADQTALFSANAKHWYRLHE